MMGDPVQPFVDIINEAVRNGDSESKYMSSERNRPVHKVSLDSYYMSAYETTYADFDIYTKDTKQPLILENERDDPVIYGPQRAVGVGWNSARNYCLWLGEKTGLPFDLPTEAQWEYAARNRGKNVVFATDTGLIERGRNFSKMDKPIMYRYPEKVGLMAPSPLGFYDLSDNAVEWVKDWYAQDYYKHSELKNPQGPKNGTEKVTRGGGLYSRLDATTVARGLGGKDLNENIPGATVRCVINTDKPLPNK